MLRALERSTIAQTLKAARASLAEPSRPFTPLDRSLFQQSDGSNSRPTSSYSMDQLSFVRDTYGNRPESARSIRSSRSRAFEPIIEEGVADGHARKSAPPDILRVGDSPEIDDGASSEGEELTPVAVSSLAGVPVPLPPRTPTKPPKPPPGSGGYPQVASSLRVASGGYPVASADTSGLSAPSHHRDSHSSRERRRSGSRKKTAAEEPSSGQSVREPSPTSRSVREPSPTSRRRKTSKSPAPSSTSQQWDSDCEELIAKLQALADSRKTITDALELSQRVWSFVSDLVAGTSGSSKPDRHAAKLLRAVLGLMDLKDTKCLFELSRCAFALMQMDSAVNGVHSSGVQAAYLNVAKVLFKCSKSDGHDNDFLRMGLLAPLLQILQSKSLECSSNDLRIYVVGVLKNISNNAANQKALIDQDALSTLFALMSSDQLTGSSKESQLLIQVTATLRNLAALLANDEADSEVLQHHFLQEDRLAALTRMMALFPGHTELLTNISRLLAKLTVHSSACEALAQSDAHMRQIAETLSSCSECAPLVLRLGFVLGNLTGNNERMRIIFSFDCQGTTLVPDLLRKYWQKDRQLAQLELEKGKAAGAQEVEEILVKLVRLLANISISPSAGEILVSSSAAVDPLLDILGAKRISDSEELVLNVVSAVTNLLFYDRQSNLLSQDYNKQLLCRLFRPLLLESYNDEALQETARALGNLSRYQDARRWMVELRLDEVLVILLNHDERDLVYYVCGTLVNLAMDPECIPRLTSACPVVQKLGKLLVDAEEAEDPTLQLVAVKVLTNMSIHSSVQWSAEDVDCLSSALSSVVSSASSSRTGEDEVEKQELLELTRPLLANLVAVSSQRGDSSRLEDKTEITPVCAPVRQEDGLYLCQFAGCGRRFKTQEKLAEHSERRHKDA